MPEGRAIEFVFPFKGANSATPRQLQPDGTVPPEALSNVMPWDRTGRMRGATRPGTHRLLASALGNGNQPVQYLGTATIALDPATIAPSVQLVSYNFPSFIGSTIASLNGGNDWKVVDNNDTTVPEGINTVVNATGMDVVTPGYARNTTGGSLDAFALYKPSLTLGSAYVVKGIVSVKGTSGTTGAGVGYAVRVNAGTLVSNQGVGALLYEDKVILDHAGNGIAATFTFVNALTLGSEHLLELRVNGNIFQVWMDGSKYLQATISADSANTGVGFCVGRTAFNFGVKTFEVWTGTNLTSYRQTSLVAVCGGNVYCGDLTALPLASGGTSVLNATAQICAASGQGAMFFVDGFTIVKLDLATRTIVPYSASVGSLPTNVTGVVLWRDRLTFYGDRLSPQNFYMSRLGVYTDFDYSQIDPAAAFAGNASTAGHIGDPIVSMIPFADDQILIAGDHNLWMMRGDPGAGGAIDLMSDSIGILGQFAWCKAPDGTVYFAGTGGLFKVRAETFAEIISERYPFFNGLNRTSNYILLAWDRDRQGMWIMATPVNTSASLNRNLWYDGRTDGYFGMGWPDTYGPICVTVYDGDGPTQRTLLMGGRAGLIFQSSDSFYDDDGQAFNSAVTMGPVKGGGSLSSYGTVIPGSDLTEGTINQLDVIFGESVAGSGTFAATVQLLSGHDANDALNLENANRRTRSFTGGGRVQRWMVRARGADTFLAVSNNATLGQYFSFERATAFVIPGGRVRH